MTIRFAAARRARNSVRQMFGAEYAPRAAANDNVACTGKDKMLRAALRHFATYGLGAAEVARVNAESAFFAGDRGQYLWWLAICRTLDRRMADAVAARREAASRA